MVWLKDDKNDDGGWTEGDDNDKVPHKYHLKTNTKIQKKIQIHKYTNTQLLIYKYISWDASLIIAPRQTVLSVSKKVFPNAEDKDFEFQIWKRKIWIFDDI